MPITHDHDFRSPEELDAFFYDQSWMITCRNQENGSYQKYLTDLTDAWKAADAQTRQQLADGQPPTALAKCIRYALIHTTIVGNLGHPSALRSVYSDDADLPPDPDALKELLTDEDTPADPSPLTLESSAQIENLRKRASALIELLKDAAEEDRDTLLQLIVETVLAIQDKFMGFPNHLWNGLEDYLTAERVAYYSRLIFASPNEVACAWFIFEWARKFNRKLLAEAIDTTFSFQDAFVRMFTLLPIIGRTHGKQRARILQRMYRALPRLDDPQLKSTVLLTLVKELKGKKRAYVVQQAILTIPRVPGHSRGWDAASLMRYLTREQRTRLLNKIVSSQYAASRVEACITLWRYLPQKTQQQMIHMALQVRDLPERAKLLAQIAYHLRSQAAYPEAIQQIVNTINAIRNEDYRRSAILAVQKVVDDDAITQAAKLPVKRLTADVETLPGYRFAFAQRDRQYLAYALGNLSAFMSDAFKTRALSLMVDLALEIDLDDYVAEAIEGIAPYLDEAHLDSALEGALRIGDSWSRVWALSGLAPYLTGEQLERCLQDALDSIGLLNNPSSQADGWYAADMAARLLPSLKDPIRERVLNNALVIAKQNPDSALAPRIRFLAYLDKEAQSDLAQEIFQDIQKIAEQDTYGYTFSALKSLAPHLPTHLIASAVQSAQNIQDSYDRESVVSALIPYVPDTQAALELAETLETAYFRSDALVRLLPRLSGESYTQALQHTMEITEEIALPGYRMGRWIDLLPFADQSLIRQKVIESMLAYLWDEKDRRRNNVLVLCATRQYISEKILPAEVLTAIGDHVMQICLEWTW